MATIKDVANAAGVSIATVSNVINDTRFVSDELRARVNSAIEQLHYEPSPFARAMKGYPTRTIGVILSKMDQTYFPQVISGIEAVAEEKGFHVVIQYTNYSLPVEKSCIHFLMNTNVNGILLNSVADSEDAAYFRWVSNLGNSGNHIPVVSLERDLTYFSMDSVCVDNIGGTIISAQHIIRQGCRRIVYIAGPANFAIANERALGFERAMNAAMDVEGDAPHTLEQRLVRSDFTPVGGYNSVRELLKSGYSFDGLLCANDAMALGALKALREYGIRCPDEVKVAGFDNNYLASLIRPSLSTVHVPQRGIGQNAAAQLIHRINNETSTPPRLIELPIRFIPRRSSDPTRNDEWELDL